MGRRVATAGIVVRATNQDGSEPISGDLYRVEIIEEKMTGRAELHVLVGGHQPGSVITVEFSPDEIRRLADIMTTTELRLLRAIADKKGDDKLRTTTNSKLH